MTRLAVWLTTVLLLGQALAPVVAAEPVPTPSAPPSFRFEHLGLEDGLSQSAILAIIQDRQGFMWFGTQDGLDRYDGYTFKVFRHDPQDPASLSHSSVLSLAQDKDGTLWVGTWGGGLDRYDPATSHFTAYKHNTANPASLSDDTVTSLLVGADGTLWVGTQAGLDRRNPDGSFSHFRHQATDAGSLSADNISALFEDTAGRLWVGTGFGIAGSGLNRLDPGADHFIRYQTDPTNLASLSGNNIGAIIQDSHGTLWVATGGYSVAGAGLNRLNEDGTFARFQHNTNDANSLGEDNILSLWQAADGVVWIGTWGGGLDLFDPYHLPAQFRHVVHDDLDSHSLSHNVVWSIYPDRSGLVWLGTVPGGLNLFNPRTAQFSLYRHQPGNPASLSMNVIGGFYQDAQGQMWVNTWGGGLDRFDLASGAFTHFRHDDAQPQSISSDLVNAVLQDHNGQYWVGTMNGLNWLDPATGSFKQIFHDANKPTSLIDDSIYQLLEDRTGQIWLGTLSGLDRYDRATGQFVHYLHDPNDPESLGNNAAIALYLDTDGAIWVGTWGGGLDRLDPATGRFKHFQNIPEDPRSLSDNSVLCIMRDRSGVLWVGTQSGLNRQEADGSFSHFHAKDGLPNEVVDGIVEDDAGHLWISTGNGLARFTPADGSFKLFDARDGLQGNEFNSNAFFRDRQGLLYFGGVNGFNVFNPALIQDNSQPPNVVVTAFRIFNEPTQADLSGASRLTVPYWQNFIAFEFSAFDYYAPQKIQYAYKLQGFDTDWVQAGSRRYASYTNLPGGDYVFQVKAANSDGVWNDTGVSIPLTVTPPLWQNWWFGAGGLSIFLSLLIFGYSWRLRNIQTQTWNLEVQVAQRTDDLRRSNELLAQEVLQRQRAEEALALRAEEQLHESEARFRAIFDSAAIGIGILGLDQLVVDANPAMCRMLGRTRAELLGLHSSQATHGDDWPESARLFEELISGQRDSYLIERRYIRKNGEVFWAQVTMSLVRASDGQPRFLVGMVIDIDQQKSAQQKLEQQEREYRQHLEERVQERTLALSQTNERLQQEIEQRRRAEEALTQKAAEEAVAAERTRLAHDLHDAVTQTLFSASLIAEVLPDLWKVNQAEALQSTDELRQLTRGALAEMRTLLLELRPAALTQTRFPDLLRQLTEALIGRTRLPITLTVDGDRRLPPEVQVALYRIAQESLNNVIKYARATQVNVNISLSSAGIHMEVSDNGIGFEPATAKPASLGLRIMRERAEAIGAEWCITSIPGKGTRVSVTWTDVAQGDL